MKDSFEHRANDWDTPEKQSMTNIFVAEMLNHIQLKSDWKVLEVGAGTGLVGLQILPKVKSFIFEDTSESMLRVLKEKVGANDAIELLHGEVYDYSHQDIDLVIAFMSLHHIENIHRVLKHLNSITTRNALVAIGDLFEEDGSFHRFEPIPHKGFDANLLAAQFESEGFDVLCNKGYSVLRRERTPGVVTDYKQFILVARKK